MGGCEVRFALRDAANEARARGKLGGVLIEAANKNSMMMAVGSSGTVLSFDYAHGNPPYYVSKGTSNEDKPMMVCYLSLAHHTEFPRKSVIPLRDGIAAVKQFVDSGEHPTCITWEEI